MITVSLRQSIIPPHLLGRVNSVYRFFAWGMMPIGAAIGGLTVLVVDRSHHASGRCGRRGSCARRSTSGSTSWGRGALTTERLDAARAEGAISSPVSDDATP